MLQALYVDSKWPNEKLIVNLITKNFQNWRENLKLKKFVKSQSFKFNLKVNFEFNTHF